MNLKEAFRYQNKLQRLMDEAELILALDQNLVNVEQTLLRSKVNSEAEDEVTVEEHDSPYAENITQVVAFLMFLLNERERLSTAIRSAKQKLPMDFDGEVSLNGKRRNLANTFRHMCRLRSSETLSRGTGICYKFNAEGNQVSYRCDMKKVTTINFDRNKVHSYAVGLEKKADRISAELDKCTVNTEVDYKPPFDVNENLPEALQWFMEQQS